MSNLVTATDDTFESEVLGAAERAGRLTIAKLDVEANPRMARRFAVRGTPTLILFAGSRTVERIVGARPKAAILRQVEPYLGAAVAS